MKPVDINITDVLNAFIYQDGMLINKITRGKAVAGSRAGWVNPKTGYRVVWLKGKPYREHRLIYAMHNDDLTKLTLVDHIDGDKANNRIENLRIASTAQNQMNLKKAKSNNSTGALGVSKHTRNKTNPYQAVIGVGGKNIHLGCFPSIELASAAYNVARAKHFGDYS